MSTSASETEEIWALWNKKRPNEVPLMHCATHWALKHAKADVRKEQGECHQHYQTAVLRSKAEAAGYFCLTFSAAWKILPTLLTIVRTTLLLQSNDQNSSHVSKEQMSYQLGWCEHRYNTVRKLRQSLVEPIMSWATGAGLQTPLFLWRATPRCMINFLAKSTHAAQTLPSR